MSRETPPRPDSEQLAAMMASAELQKLVDATATPAYIPATTEDGQSSRLASISASTRTAVRSFDLPLAASIHPVVMHLRRNYREPRPKPAAEQFSQETLGQPPSATLYSSLRVAYTGMLSIGSLGTGRRENYGMYSVYEPGSPIDGLSVITGKMNAYNRESGAFETVRNFGILDLAGIHQLDQTVRFVMAYGNEVTDER